MQWLSCEAFDDPPDAVLFPEKEAVISRAVGKRRREFRTVRHCARRALTELGLPPAAVLPGERREPVWPPGVVGSLPTSPVTGPPRSLTDARG
jgi:4'-phosphopantetheinyl transferase EntD